MITTGEAEIRAVGRERAPAPTTRNGPLVPESGPAVATSRTSAAPGRTSSSPAQIPAVKALVAPGALQPESHSTASAGTDESAAVPANSASFP